MRTAALLFIAGLLCSCDGMVEKPVSPPGAASETVAWCGPDLGSEVLR